MEDDDETRVSCDQAEKTYAQISAHALCSTNSAVTHCESLSRTSVSGLLSRVSVVCSIMVAVMITRLGRRRNPVRAPMVAAADPDA